MIYIHCCNTFLNVFTTQKYTTLTKTKKMRIEHLINDTYQITDGSTVWFQGSLSDCKLYLNQNKDDYSFTRVSVEERQRERSDKYDYLIGDDDYIKPNQNKDE